MAQSTLRALSFTINPEEELELPIFCDYVRVKSSSVEVNVSTQEGDAFTLTEGEEASLGETRRVKFSHNSGLAQIIVLIFGINATVGSARLSGTVALDSATLVALENVTAKVSPKTYTGSHAQKAALAALTPEQIVAPAANVNGVVVNLASFWVQNATSTPMMAMLAKNAAPASLIDGDLIMSSDGMFTAAGSFNSFARLESDVFIAAGKGLYFIADIAILGTTGIRKCLYTIL